MQDEAFWSLVDDYESGKMSVDDVIAEICRNTKNYNVAIADFGLVVKRVITKEEKLKIKEYLDGKNNRRGYKPNQRKS